MKLTSKACSTAPKQQSVLVKGGFTIIEVLVVLAVMAVMISLALPAIMRARASARKVTCLNHLRQVAIAVTSNVDQNNRFPAAGLISLTGGVKYQNWVTTVLPNLDQVAIFQSYNPSQPYDSEDNFKVTQKHLPVLVCPDDFTIQAGQGNLSYVVNGGVGWTIPVDCPARMHVENEQVVISPFDLNGNGTVCPSAAEPGPEPSDVEVLKDLSLFFVENWPIGQGTQRFHRLRDLTDGASSTILLAENLRAGFDPEDPKTSWGSSDPLRSMFFVSSLICEDGKCEPGKVDLLRANSRLTKLQAQESLNSGLSQAEGTAPWPTSGHAGLVHVAWCDDHVSALSDQVDGKVYFDMVTPRGNSAPVQFRIP